MLNLDPDDMPATLSRMFSTRHNSQLLIAGVNDDDCAAVHWDSPLLVATSDFVNSNPISLELGIGDLSTVGRLVVAANVSDLLGSGARPKYLLLSIMMPRACSREDFLLLMSGVQAEAAKCNLEVIGGDTKLGKTLAVAGTAIGSCGSESKLFLKHRARAGDDLWVSGPIGGCSAAVLGLTKNISDSSWREWAIQTLTLPLLPFRQSIALSELGLSCAGTDISDGLGMDLCQMCELSGVGANVAVAQIPQPSQVAFAASCLSIPAWAFSFGVGGDFQFLVTSRTEHRHLISKLGFTLVGCITPDSALTLTMPDGTIKPMPIDGHRDGKRLSFTEEISRLLAEVQRVQ